MAAQTVIQTFGKADYKRIMNMGNDEIREIEEIQDNHLKNITVLLNDLIQKNKLYLMDKESGVAFEASVVIGFKNGGLLIANER